jgi:hypothetical protein
MVDRDSVDPLAGWFADQNMRMDAGARRSRLVGLVLMVLSLAIIAAVLAGCRT